MAKSPVVDINGIDWMAQQNGGAFDPVLFGDYRDPQDNIINNNAFGDFFNDAFPSQDFGTPYNTGEAPPKKDLMQEIEVQKNASPSELGPKENPKTAVTCDLWFVPCAFVTVVIRPADCSRTLGIVSSRQRKCRAGRSTWTISARSSKRRPSARERAR